MKFEKYQRLTKVALSPSGVRGWRRQRRLIQQARAVYGGERGDARRVPFWTGTAPSLVPVGSQLTSALRLGPSQLDS